MDEVWKSKRGGEALFFCIKFSNFSLWGGDGRRWRGGEGVPEDANA